MIIGIGSTNPVKQAAVEQAVRAAHQHLGLADLLDFQAHEVPSGVPAQPFSDEETKRGALNRLSGVLSLNSAIDLAFGLEGGVVELADGLYSTVWIAVGNQAGKIVVANGIRFPLPENLAVGIRSGQEMGAVMDQLCQTTGVKHGAGMIGVLTGGVVTRTQAYSDLARIAYGLFLPNFTAT